MRGKSRKILAQKMVQKRKIGTIIKKSPKRVNEKVKIKQQHQQTNILYIGFKV